MASDSIFYDNVTVASNIVISRHMLIWIILMLAAVIVVISAVLIIKKNSRK